MDKVRKRIITPTSLGKGYIAAAIFLITNGLFYPLLGGVFSESAQKIFASWISWTLAILILTLYFYILIDKAIISVLLAVSSIFPFYIVPLYFYRFMHYVITKLLVHPIEIDLVFFGLLLGFLLSGFGWGLILHKYS